MRTSPLGVRCPGHLALHTRAQLAQAHAANPPWGAAASEHPGEARSEQSRQLLRIKHARAPYAAHASLACAGACLPIPLGVRQHVSTQAEQELPHIKHTRSLIPLGVRHCAPAPEKLTPRRHLTPRRRVSIQRDQVSRTSSPEPAPIDQLSRPALPNQFSRACRQTLRQSLLGCGSRSRQTPCDSSTISPSSPRDTSRYVHPDSTSQSAHRQRKKEAAVTSFGPRVPSSDGNTRRGMSPWPRWPRV